MSLAGLRTDAETLVRAHTLTRTELYTFNEVHNAAVFNPSHRVWKLVEDQVKLYEESLLKRLIYTLNLQASHTEIYLRSVNPSVPAIPVLEYIRLAPIICFMHLVREIVDEDFPTTYAQIATTEE